MLQKLWQKKAFYPVGQDKVQAAKRLIDSCKKCICAVEEFGPLNEANRELAEYARRIGEDWQKHMNSIHRDIFKLSTKENG